MLKTTTFKKGSVTFSDTGKGRVVVLLHGFLGSHHIWENTISELSKSYRVIAIDLPGHGTTDCFGYVHTMELLAKCVKAVMDSLRLKKYVIIGHSMGGYVGLALADLYPDNLKGLCLFHSSAYADSEEKIQIRTKAIEFVKENGVASFLKTTIPGLFSENFREQHKEVIDQLITASSKFSKGAIIQYYQAMIARPERTKIFTFFRNPILFIIGERDNAIPLDQSLKQCHQPFISDLHLLPEVAHMGMLEDEMNCNNIIQAFLGRD